MFNEQDYERAQALQQKEIETALSDHRARERQGDGEPFCLECGEEIPEARRRSVRAVLCVACQTLDEKRNRARGM